MTLQQRKKQQQVLNFGTVVCMCKQVTSPTKKRTATLNFGTVVCICKQVTPLTKKTTATGVEYRCCCMHVQTSDSQQRKEQQQVLNSGIATRKESFCLLVRFYSIRRAEALVVCFVCYLKTTLCWPKDLLFGKFLIEAQKERVLHKLSSHCMKTNKISSYFLTLLWMSERSVKCWAVQQMSDKTWNNLFFSIRRPQNKKKMLIAGCFLILF